MTTTIRIIAFEDRVGKDCFNALRRLHPPGASGGVFEAYFSPGDKTVDKLLKCLTEHGLKPRENARQPNRAGFIDITHLRKYEERDFAESLYLDVRAEESISYDGERDRRGRLVLLAENLREFRSPRIAAVWDGLVVADHIRKKMEHAGLIGLGYKPVLIAGEGAGDYPEPWWELQSELILPPLSPRVKFCDCYGGSEINNPDKGCAVDDGLCLPIELRYTAKAIRSVEPFDLARTKELFGFGLSSRYTVVSKRFYRFARENRLKMIWAPVRIDPD